MSIEVWILDGARTARCRYVGQFSRVSAIDLGAIAAKGAMERAGVEPSMIDHVVIGNAQQTSPDAIYGARHVGLKAGVDDETPALTVNRLCGSGIQSIVTAAQLLQLGEAEIVLAGGMENMTQAPHVIYGARTGFPLADVGAARYLLRLHHVADLRQPGAQVRHQPRGAGRVRPRQPAARR